MKAYIQSEIKKTSIKSLFKTAVRATVIGGGIYASIFFGLQLYSSYTIKNLVSEATTEISELKKLIPSKDTIEKSTDRFEVAVQGNVIYLQFKTELNPFEVANRHIIFSEITDSKGNTEWVCRSNVSQKFLPKDCEGLIPFYERVIEPKKMYEGTGNWLNGFHIENGVLTINGMPVNRLTYETPETRDSKNTHFVSLDNGTLSVDENGAIHQYWRSIGEGVVLFKDGTAVKQGGKYVTVDGRRHLIAHISILKGYSPPVIQKLSEQVKADFDTLVKEPTEENLHNYHLTVFIFTQAIILEAKENSIEHEHLKFILEFVQ